MKALFSILVFIAIFPALPAQAQSDEKPLRSLINIVNLIPGNVRTEISLNEKKLLPRGMKSGAETGWFSLPEGELEMTVKSGESPVLSKMIDLNPATGTVIAVYLQPNPKRRPDGTPFPPKLRLETFQTYEAGVHGLRIISLCPTENVFWIGPARMSLKPSQMTESRSWNGAGFNITSGGKVIGKVGNCPQKANYYVFIAPANDGTFFAAKANADQLASRRNSD